MKTRFLQFLKESGIDKDLGIDDSQKYVSFDSNGNAVGLEEGRYDWEKSDFLLEQYEKELNEGNQTFGQECIVNLDIDSIEDGKPKGGEQVEESGEITDYLMKRGRKSIDDLKRDFLQYTVDPPDAPQTGYKLYRRKFYDQDGERHELSREEIEQILIQKNRLAKKPDSYSFSPSGDFLKNGKKISDRNKIGAIKKINTAVEKWQKKNKDTRKIHFKWEKDQSGKFTNKLMVNTTDWDGDDETDLRRYDSAEYEVVTKPETADELLGIINKTDRSEEINKTRGGWDYDFERNIFTLNGQDVYGKQLLKMVNGINGGISLDKKQAGFQEEGSYWEHFKISIAGSKVGDVANFSLPPVSTCNHDAPCIFDGCYALKAYGQYPLSKMAQEINLALLQDGRYEQFEREISAVFRRKSKPMKYFRFFVSGDCFSKKLLESICRIAENNGEVSFWMYTKQYALLHSFDKARIPQNLTILVSCWGDFCPALYDPSAPNKRVEDGKTAPFATLERDFPLAYLDDGTENTRKYMNVEKKQIVCPCTDDDEVISKCDSCKKCFEVRQLGGNIVFRKH